MMRSERLKLKEQTIARFLGDLCQDIVNMFKLQPYCTFDDVCKLGINMKKQKRKEFGFQDIHQRDYFYQGFNLLFQT